MKLKLLSTVGAAAFAVCLTAMSAFAQTSSPPGGPPALAGGPAPVNADDEGGGSEVSTKTVVTAVACVVGGGIIASNPPVPLAKMSKRQKRRFQIEVRRWKRALLEWAVGCGVAGPVGGSAAIAADDFASRFITREIPIARTPRQEQLLFCRDGTAKCPDLTGSDPHQYGPR